ncbi:hypothetical protein C8J55DRAFT_91367 [Lentinula edodes]|uniref:Uncharacterized protein n=1 Tax=Lentinula lateritia TaxID=40482 RepID=A0A9W9A869_9AGAR|nr:hypothetical protein C8J55DRAFT_91367 [Lentinula edodes]
MLFLNRIFRSPSSSLSPTLYHPLHFLSLFTLALLISSVITFAEGTPLPPGISQQSEAPKKIHLLPSGFEKCTPSATSGFLFRVGFYDSTSRQTTKSGHGVLVLCIGKNNCFGYTTTTTGGSASAAGTQHSDGLVIHTATQRRTGLAEINSRVYQRLPNITPNCDKFNTWSEQNYEKTLVNFLMSIADLQNALSKLDTTVTITIDSQVSYILGVLDYLHSKGMIETYDKSQIETFLKSLQSLQLLQSPKPLPCASKLSWGFRGSNQRHLGHDKWMLLVDVKLPKKTSPILCFGLDHCFGLKIDDTVRDIKPTLKSNRGKETPYVNTRNHFPLGSATLYPSFNLQNFENHLQTSSTTSFFARLIGHSHPPVRFKDISSEEIKRETGLEKEATEDQESFYFRVLLGYMAAKGIIGNYNKDTYGEIMEALELVRTGKRKAAGAEEERGDDSSPSLPSGGGPAQPAQADHSQRISVSSMLNSRANSLSNH